MKKALADIGIGTTGMLREAVKMDMVSESILKGEGVKPFPARLVMKAAAQVDGVE